MQFLTIYQASGNLSDINFSSKIPVLPFEDCLEETDFAGDELFLFFECEGLSEVEVVDFEGYVPPVSAIGEVFKDFLCLGALGYGEVDAV